MIEQQPWSIIGSGPVGSMQAVILATLFPGQEIYCFDKHHEHVRGHGLQLWNTTIDHIILQLREVQKQARDELRKSEDPAAQGYYKIVIKNVDQTANFLTKNFKGFFSGGFIRTNKISEMLQTYAETLSKKNNNDQSKVHFLLNNEVSKQHLEKLENPENLEASSSVPDVTWENLKKSSIIFCADGSHSKARDVIFNENDEQLKREELNYLLEIKLDMNTQSNFIFDQIKRSAAPTLKKNRFHFWSQTKDGTATLRIIIDEESFKALREAKDKNQKMLGDYANPYRRLVELPHQQQSAISRIIQNILGLDNFDASTMKITAIPLHVYKAQSLVKEVNNKKYFLIGDAAAGLVLAKGVNTGFMMTAEFGKSLFEFKLDPLQQDEFITQQQTKTALQKCEDRIKQIVDQQIEKIKGEFETMDYINGYSHSIASPYDLNYSYKLTNEKYEKPNDIVKQVEFKKQFEQLVKAIPRFDYDKELDQYYKYANWLLRLDMLQIKINSSPFYNDKNNLSKFIEATELYVKRLKWSDHVAFKHIATTFFREEILKFKHHNKGVRYLTDLAEEVVKAGNLLIAYEAFEINKKMLALNGEISKCEAKFGEGSQLIEQLNTFSAHIANELKSPALDNETYVTILTHFTQLLNQLAKSSLTLEQFENSLHQLDRKLFGKPLMSQTMKIIIVTIIGAIVGLIAGAVVGAVLTGWSGCWGALPGAILAAAKGASIGATLAAGGVVAGSTLTGFSGGFFISQHHKSVLKELHDDVKVYEEMEMIGDTIRSEF